MNNKDYQKFLNSIILHSKFNIIENAKEDSKLMEIAESRGINVEKATDLAFFKNVYALTDVPNANKCILPKDAIEPALDTINGKPIDIDHIRTAVVGHYLGAEIEDDVIYAYGVLYKASFADEWEEAKKLFDAGKLSTSFEIFCAQDDREYHSDGTYSLLKPIIAGGAILFKTTPAFKEAKVLEVAKKRKYDTTTWSSDSVELVCARKEEDIIQADLNISRFYDWDINLFQTMNWETKCPACEQVGYNTIDSIDFKNGKIFSTCYCGAVLEADINPKATVIDFVEVAKNDSFDCVCPECGNKQTSTEHCKDTACSECGTSMRREGFPGSGNPNNANENKNKEKQKENAKMEQEIKELEAELAKLKVDMAAKDEELKVKSEEASLKDEKITALEDAKTQMDGEVQTKLEEAQKEAEAKIEAAKKEATIVAERKSELGEFAKELEDADILNDDKFENAKLKKEISEIKASKDVLVADKEVENANVIGGDDNKESELTKSQKEINEIAYGKDKK